MQTSLHVVWWQTSEQHQHELGTHFLGHIATNRRTKIEMNFLCSWWTCEFDRVHVCSDVVSTCFVAQLWQKPRLILAPNAKDCAAEKFPCAASVTKTHQEKQNLGGLDTHCTKIGQDSNRTLIHLETDLDSCLSFLHGPFCQRKKVHRVFPMWNMYRYCVAYIHKECFLFSILILYTTILEFSHETH